MHSLTLSLAGTFTPTPQLYMEGERASELNTQLLEKLKAARAIRADLVVDDLTFVFEQIASVRAGNDARTRELRRRYTVLLLDGPRTPSPIALPGPPPSSEEVRQRWQHPG